MENKLLKEMFKKERWEAMIDKAEQKGINYTTLRQMCDPRQLVLLYNAIVTERYDISVPHIVLIPKDKPGEFRECKANEDVDRILLTLINDCLMDLFPNMIHKQCKSYQKGLGCSEVVQSAVGHIKNIKRNKLGYKLDLSKYFDSVNIKYIDMVFDRIEKELGFSKGTEPVMNMLRKYYHNDWLFDADGNLVQKYTSLKQGSAVASFLADVILYDIDYAMSQLCEFYVRYSDDILLIDRSADLCLSILKKMLERYGLSLNPKKVEMLTKDKWFTFLGFNIKGDLITLSPNRIKKLQKEITDRTISKAGTNVKQAKNNLFKYLYEGEYNWATSCFSIINCKHDIDEINKFILDCLRACEVRDIERKLGKRVYPIKVNKIGGLGVELHLNDRTIARGKGKIVKLNKNKTRKEMEKYVTVKCLVNDYQQSKSLFQAVVRGIQ